MAVRQARDDVADTRVARPVGQPVRRRHLHEDARRIEQPLQRVDRAPCQRLGGPDHREVVDHDGNLVPRAERRHRLDLPGPHQHLQMPAQRTHQAGECRNVVEPEAPGAQKVDPDPAHPEAMEPGDLLRAGAGRDHHHAAQHAGMRLQRLQQGAVVGARDARLHDDPALDPDARGERQPVGQRRDARRVLPLRRQRQPLAEDVEMTVAGARRQQRARPPLAAAGAAGRSEPS